MRRAWRMVSGLGALMLAGSALLINAEAARADTPSSDLGDFAGAIDQIRPDGFVSGWVYQASRPGQVAEFRTGGGYLRLHTGEYRADVKGGGPYGFSGWLSDNVLDGASRTFTISVDSGGSTDLVTKDYAAVNRAPTGWLESVRDGAGNGWAFDADNAAAALTVTVRVLCPNGQPAGFNAEESMTVTTGDDRPDVRAAYPQAAVGNAGYRFAVSQPERFRGRGCKIDAYAGDAQGNPEAETLLSTKDTATLNSYSLPFD